MKHYYIKAVGFEMSHANAKITSIEFTELHDDETKLTVSVELHGEIVAVFAVHKEDLRDVLAWFDAKPTPRDEFYKVAEELAK